MSTMVHYNDEVAIYITMFYAWLLIYLQTRKKNMDDFKGFFSLLFALRIMADDKFAISLNIELSFNTFYLNIT